jgi:5-methylcytosine-specific restriction endonuclease McrA
MTAVRTWPDTTPADNRTLGLSAVPDRACASCGDSLEGMRPHAVYCSRKCKARASQVRRNADGREHARDVARYAEDGERQRAQARAWSKAHPECARTKKHRRRNAETLLVTERDWQRLVARFGGLCAYCQSRPATEHDHIFPISKGGRHSIGNLLPACQPCNLSKRDHLLVVWRARRSRGGDSPLPLFQQVRAAA